MIINSNKKENNIINKLLDAVDESEEDKDKEPEFTGVLTTEDSKEKAAEAETTTAAPTETLKAESSEADEDAPDDKPRKKKKKKEKESKLKSKIHRLYEAKNWKWIFGCFIAAFFEDILLEIMGRRSVTGAFSFMVHSSLIFLINILIIFATMLLGLLFRK